MRLPLGRRWRCRTLSGRIRARSLGTVIRLGRRLTLISRRRFGRTILWTCLRSPLWLRRTIVLRRRRSQSIVVDRRCRPVRLLTIVFRTIVLLRWRRRTIRLRSRRTIHWLLIRRTLTRIRRIRIRRIRTRLTRIRLTRIRLVRSRLIRLLLVTRTIPRLIRRRLSRTSRNRRIRMSDRGRRRLARWRLLHHRTRRSRRGTHALHLTPRNRLSRMRGQGLLLSGERNRRRGRRLLRNHLPVHYRRWRR